jgi:Flp pilus assembly protein TadD
MRIKGLISGLIVLATLAVFWQTFHFDFVSYDDNDYVTENPHVTSGLTVDNLRWATTAVVSGTWQPLVWLTFMIDQEAGEGQAWAFHVTNVLLHAATAVLLFLLLETTTQARWRSALVAALFAIHPLHVESVAWVSERKDVLSTLFWVLTMLLYVAYVRKPSARRYLAALVLFSLGLTAKAMLVSLPLVLLLMDVWPLNRRVRLLEKIPFVLVAAASCVVTLWAQSASRAVSTLELIPIGQRLANAGVSTVAYIAKTVWPHNLTMHYPHPGKTLSAWQVAAAWVLVAAACATAAALIRKRPAVTVGWFWFVLTLVPVSGIVQVGSQGMADRYTYVPLIGLFVALAWTLPDLSGRQWLRIAGLVILLGVLAALGFRAHNQAQFWRNSETLYRHATRITPNDPQAYYGLGCAIRAKGSLAGAIKQFEKAVELDPEDSRARSNLGVALYERGDLPEAADHLSVAVHLNPTDADLQTNCAMALALQGRLTESLPHFKAAVRLRPDDSGLRNNLGRCLVLLGRIQAAKREFAEAIRLDPSNETAQANYDACVRRSESR